MKISKRLRYGIEVKIKLPYLKKFVLPFFIEKHTNSQGIMLQDATHVLQRFLKCTRNNTCPKGKIIGYSTIKGQKFVCLLLQAGFAANFPASVLDRV